jgi:diguanylate cyclase (GGDEF)-like protein
MPQCDLQCANIQAERLRSEIENLKIHKGEEITPVTASFGVVSKESLTSDVELMTKQADIALYQAKGRGRNCAVEYQPNLAL